MVRYDKQDESKANDLAPDSNIKKVIIGVQHQRIIQSLFIKLLKGLHVNNVMIVNNITQNIIQLNPNVSLEQLSETLGKKLNSKTQFIKELYIYKLDDMINEAYGQTVVAIQELPYYFQEQEQNENIINFEFMQ